MLASAILGFAELVIGPATSGRTRWLNLGYGIHLSPACCTSGKVSALNCCMPSM